MTQQPQSTDECRTGMCPGPVKLSPQAVDFLGCLLTATMAALPAFLQAFVSCLGGGGASGNDDYQPGSRERCT